jgi:hypothetical protein
MQKYKARGSSPRALHNHIFGTLIPQGEQKGYKSSLVSDRLVVAASADTYDTEDRHEEIQEIQIK